MECVELEVRRTRLEIKDEASRRFLAQAIVKRKTQVFPSDGGEVCSIWLATSGGVRGRKSAYVFPNRIEIWLEDEMDGVAVLDVSGAPEGLRSAMERVKEEWAEFKRTR